MLQLNKLIKQGESLFTNRASCWLNIFSITKIVVTCFLLGLYHHADLSVNLKTIKGHCYNK